VAVAGNHAYVANSTDGLRVYDVSDPANPINTGHGIYNGSAQCVAVAGNYAYVSGYTDGMRIFDVSDLTNVVSVGNINNPGTGFGITVSGNYVYLANGADRPAHLRCFRPGQSLKHRAYKDEQTMPTTRRST